MPGTVMWEGQGECARHNRPSPCGALERAQGDVVKDAPPPLSCIPLVVMQKTSQGLNWTENADNADEAEITQAAYFLRFANGMNRIREGLAVGGVSCEPLSKSNSLLTGILTAKS